MKTVVQFFYAKAACITIGAMAAAYIVTQGMHLDLRVASVIGAGAGALCTYLFNPTQPPASQKLGSLEIEKDPK